MGPIAVTTVTTFPPKLRFLSLIVRLSTIAAILL